MPSKKIEQLERQFKREIKRLEKLVQVAKLKGVKFDVSPIPKMPKELTQEKLDLVKSIDAAEILSGRGIPDIDEYIQKQIKTADLPEHHGRRRGNADEYLRRPRLKGPEKEREHLSPEELARIRSEAAKKAAATRRERELNDPEYAEHMREVRRRSLESRMAHERSDPKFKARMDAIRRANLEKARANRQPVEPKPKKPKLTPEELKKVRQESARKATAARKAREASDPEFKKAMDEQRRAALDKARLARQAKPKKEKPKKTAEELKKIRSEAAKKAAETRRKHEAEDPEYKARMDAIRRENLKKARDEKAYRKLEAETPEFDPFESEQYYPSEDELLYDGFEDRMGSPGASDIFGVLYDEIKNYIDENGRGALLRKLVMIGDDLLDDMDSLLYQPYDDDVREFNMKLLGVLFDGQVPTSVQQRLEEAIQNGIKNKKIITRKIYNRRRGML